MSADVSAPMWGEKAHSRRGFFTDTSICIGCKACEVACKEWNRNPQDGTFELLESSYDNTGALGANTWRHVAFIEQDGERAARARESGRRLVSLGMPTVRTGAPQPSQRPQEARPEVSEPAEVSGASDLSHVDRTPPDTAEFRWLMSSDVCKHCTHAGCLDVCPTGALFRTEFGTVVVQNDVCNGCGTCVAGCPFGVIERRDDGTVNTPTQREDKRAADMPIPNKGTANKCTLCYDRLLDGQTPACAKACPTTSISFGERTEMVARAEERVAELHARGLTEARLYGANPRDGVGGTGSVFLLLDEPEVYGLPPDPHVPTRDMPGMWKLAGAAAVSMLGAAAVAFAGGLRG